MNAGTLARALQAHETALRSLPLHAHASWLMPLGLPTATGLGIRPDGAHWAAALGVAPLTEVSAATLLAPAHRLALLAPDAAARLLRLRALMHRRRSLRASLQSSVREQARRWLGDAGWRSLMYDAPDAIHDAGLPLVPPAELPQALAWDGYCRLAQESAWTEPGPARLMRLRFGRALPPPPAAPPEPALTAWWLARVDPLTQEEST